MALLAELIGEAMLGPIITEMNWLLVCIDTTLYSDGERYKTVAEGILQEIRTCPPADGFERVEIPGERERALQQANAQNGIAIPEQTWEQIQALADRLGADGR